jgi:hypothetical protein
MDKSLMLTWKKKCTSNRYTSVNARNVEENGSISSLLKMFSADKEKENK